MKEEKGTETKLCKHCKTEIPKKAKVCPNCRKKQSGIGKWILIVVIAFILFEAVSTGEQKPKKAEPETIASTEKSGKKKKKAKDHAKSEESEKETEEQTEEQTEQPKTNAGTPVQKEPEQQEEQKQEDGPSYRVVNIMEEILTPELILDALKSNGTCTCSRCQADVKALMLTRLPPKYIVADNTTVPMLLTFYRNKFRVAVLSQSMRACMEVKEHPRHIL